MNIDLGMAEPWAAQVSPSMEPAGSTLREFLTICFRDRVRIALAFLIPFLFTLVISSMPSTKYTAEATLLVRLGREYVYKPEVGDSVGGAPIAYDGKETLRAEVEILNSVDIKEAVIKQLGTAKIYPWMVTEGASAEQQSVSALREFQSRFEARFLKDTNVIQLNYTHKDPEIAALVLNKVVEAYLERRRGIFSSSNYASAQAKVVSLGNRLNELETKLEAYKREHDIQSFGEQQTLMLGRKHSIEMRLDDAALALAQTGTRSASLLASLDFVSVDVTLSRETVRSEAIESARKTLLDLRLKERDLSSKFSEDSVPVMDVRADIARTEAFVKEMMANPSQNVRTGRSPVRDQVEGDWLRAQVESRQAGTGKATLLQQRQQVDSKLKELSNSQRELLAMERERKLVESSYEAAMKRLEEAMVLDELDRGRKSNVSIVQAARPPIDGKSQRSVILMVGTLISLCCALLMAFLSALLRDTFLSPEQLQRSLGLPLLAVVPKGGR